MDYYWWRHKACCLQQRLNECEESGGGECPELSVEITGATEPNQFEATTYTANLSGTASLDVADYEFHWYIQQGGTDIYHEDTDGVNTIDLTFNNGGVHNVFVRAINKNNGVSASDTLEVDVQETDLFLNIFEPTNKYFGMDFMKTNKDQSPDAITLRLIGTGETRTFQYHGTEIIKSEINDWRGGAEVAVVSVPAPWTFGRDSFSQTMAQEPRLTDGSGNLNVDADGYLYVIPSQNSARHGWDFSIANGDGQIRGTFIMIADMPDNGTSFNTLFANDPFIQKTGTNDQFRIGKNASIDTFDTIPEMVGSGIKIITFDIFPSGNDSKIYVNEDEVFSFDFSDTTFSNAFVDMFGSNYQKAIYAIRYFLDNKTADLPAIWARIMTEYTNITPN